MSTQKQEFLTPVGRLVQGDPFEAQTKNMQGQPLMTKAGQPTQKYFVAVAFRKDDPNFAAFYGLLAGVARQSFPQLFDAAGNCTRPNFSWKLVDGDSAIPDDSGRKPCDKEGFPGHWVVRFSSTFPPRCFYAGRYQPHEQMQDKKAIRRGYFVRVAGTVEGNNDTLKPGLYVNLGMVELAAQGPEIVSGPDASAVFGAAPAPALPPGATMLPATGGAPQAPAMPTAPQMPAMPATPIASIAPAAPGTQPAIPGLPAAVAPAPLPVAPNPAFVNGPQVAPVPPAPPAPPVAPAVPAGPQLTAAAHAKFPGGTFAQWLASGWTESAMRTAGYVV